MQPSTERRSFMLRGAAALASLPISSVLFQSALARAAEPSDWFEVPGTDGGIKLKSLWKEGTAEAQLIQFAPGFPVGAHSHPGGESVYVLEGSIDTGSETLEAEQFTYSAPGTAHAAGGAGPKGAKILVFTLSPIVFG